MDPHVLTTLCPRTADQELCTLAMPVNRKPWNRECSAIVSAGSMFPGMSRGSLFALRNGGPGFNGVNIQVASGLGRDTMETRKNSFWPWRGP